MRYAIIGAGGYIAPRHMAAINAVGGEIVVACDLSDSMGILDKYAPRCRVHRYSKNFFEDINDIDVVVVCSPNEAHEAHATAALSESCRVVLEKPAAINALRLHELSRAPFAHQMVTPVAQLRYHEGVARLRDAAELSSVCEIEYHVYRGPWYERSWKTDPKQSGGLMLNLGVHLVDLCLHLFGPLVEVYLAREDDHSMSGSFECTRGRVVFSLDRRAEKQQRVIRIGDVAVDLTQGMEGLHQRLYEDLERGERVCTLREAIEAAEACLAITAAAERAEDVAA